MPSFAQPGAASAARDFVEVGAGPTTPTPRPAATNDRPATGATPIEPLFEVTPTAAAGEPRWSLWSDLDA